MALTFDEGSDTLDVISSKDAAVLCDKDAYAEYLKTLDESHLKLDPNVAPTRFVLKKVLSYDEQRRIKNNQLGYKDGDMQLRLGFIVDEVRYRMVDIKGGGKGIEFKKDSDGYVTKSLVEKLDSYGIVKELHDAAQAALSLKPFPKLGALLELAFADIGALAKEGRNFNCAVCPNSIQKIRRCREDREDFTAKDGAQFPIQIHKGAGEMYGFCPAKATWDPAVKAQFEELVVIAETKWFPYPGGLYSQPAWLVEVLAWFLPKYDFMKFLRKADMIVGGTGDKTNKGQIKNLGSQPAPKKRSR